MEFPKMVAHDLTAERRRQHTSKKEPAGPGTDAPPDEVTRSFGEALASWIQATTEAGLQETRLSLDRASTLVQLRTNAAMRAWTIALTVLTAAVVALTVAVVVITSRSTH